MDELAPIHRGGPSDLAAGSYLANLRPSGRRTMTGALSKLSTILCGHAEWMRCPWHLVRYEHAAAVRAVLQAQYAPATVNKHLTALRGVMRECWRMQLVDGDTLARVVDIPNVKGRRLPAGRMISKQELAFLWGQADRLGPRYGALLALLFHAGLRRSEAASVAVEHLTDETAHDGAQVVWVKVVDGKGGKERRVPVRGTAACRLLRVRDGARNARGLVLGCGGGRGVAKLLERMVAHAGISHASCHDLRRSFVSHALAGGAPIADVARAAGHSDPRTTAGYDRRSDDALVGVADALDA